jgi:hypothetical protein
MYLSVEETQMPWEEDTDSPDSTYNESEPRETPLANNDELYEHLGLDVDLLPQAIRDQIPDWIRAAVGFYRMADYDSCRQPEYGSETPEYFEWGDWEMKDFASGETHKRSLVFGGSDVRALISGRSIDIATPWPAEAKRLVLAIFLLDKNERRLQDARKNLFPKADIWAIRQDLKTQRELIRSLLREALGMPRLELDFGEL